MKTLTLLLFLICSSAYAHNEDKYGPHGGYIKMPSTFHTELVPEGNGNFMVYLVDLQNKNATVKNSSVELSIKSPTTEVAFKCIKMEDHFYCLNEKKIEATKGSKLQIIAKRLGVQAKKIDYDIPLKLEVKNVKSEDHSKHQ